MNDPNGPTRTSVRRAREARRLARRIPAAVPGAAALLAALAVSAAFADHEGLPFTEEFDDAHLSDPEATTADWSGGALRLPTAEPLNAPFDPAASGEVIGTEPQITRGVALADMNGDGWLDLIEGTAGTNGVYLNDGGSFPTRIEIAPDTHNTRGIRAGDMDGDGDLDIVVGNLNAPVQLYLNAGDGVQYVGSNVSQQQWPVDSIALGDFNGDGHLDVATAIQGKNFDRIFYNTGDPLAPFGADGVEGIPVSTVAEDAQEVAAGDMNNDGRIDLVLFNQNQPNRVYLNDGGNHFTQMRIGDETDNTQAGAVGDLNGDGFLDVVVGNYPPGTINRIYLNSGDPAAPFSDATQPIDFTVENDPSYVHDVKLGDVDNDGDLDILLGTAGVEAPDPNVTRFTNRLYLNDGTGMFSASTDVGADMDVTNESAIGDVDNDGLLDIVAGNEDRAGGNGATPGVSRLYRNTGTPSGAGPVLQLVGRATSLRVDTESEPIATISLSAEFDPLGLHNFADFWVSANGGANWLHIVPGGRPIVFPEGIQGTDLRWRVDLRSSSPGADAAQALALASVTLAIDAPTFTSTPVTEATVDTEYVYEVAATDPDDGDTLTLTAPTLPAWLTFTDNGDGTGVLTGTPTSDDVGDHPVVLEVSDAAGTTTQQSFTVTVAGTGGEPSITSEPVTSAAAGAEYVYAITATDPDGDALTLTAPTLPEWLTLTDNGDGTGTLTGTPGEEHVGDHVVELEVVDATGLASAQGFTITVAAAGSENAAPEFVSAPSEEATAGSAFSYAVDVDDPDGDAVTITATTLPEWLTLTDNGDGTAALEGTPGEGDVGDHEVVLEAADAAGATAEQAFTITVGAAGGSPSPNPSPPPRNDGGGGSAGLGDLLGLAALTLLLGWRRRRNGA